LFKKYRLTLIFVLFFPALLKTIENLPKAPTRFTFPSNEILMKKIEAVLPPQTVMIDTQKNVIVKSIDSSDHRSAQNLKKLNCRNSEAGFK